MVSISTSLVGSSSSLVITTEYAARRQRGCRCDNTKGSQRRCHSVSPSGSTSPAESPRSSVTSSVTCSVISSVMASVRASVSTGFRLPALLPAGQAASSVQRPSVDGPGTICQCQSICLAGFCNLAERRMRIAARLGIQTREMPRCPARRAGRALPGACPGTTGFEQAEHGQRASTPHCRASTSSSLQNIRSILVAILVHVEPRHGEPGLRRVRRIRVVASQLTGNSLRILEVAISDMHSPMFQTTRMPRSVLRACCSCMMLKPMIRPTAIMTPAMT